MTKNASPAASTLLGLFEHVPAEKTAIILPDHAIRVSYGSLRSQVQALAEQLPPRVSDQPIASALRCRTGCR